MAVRTGAQIKTDMAAADAALTTAITTPTEANINAAIAAFQTVETNGLDSRGLIAATAQGKNYAQDVAIYARAAKRDLQLTLRRAVNSAAVVDTEGARSMLQRLQANLAGGGKWKSYQDIPTTT